MIRVLLESPYAGDVKRNLAYARDCMKDCLLRGESPYASHLLFTQEGILNDNIPAERQLGIDAGLLWGQCAEKTVVYCDLGISKGMEYGIAAAMSLGRPVEYRTLNPNTPKEAADSIELDLSKGTWTWNPPIFRQQFA